MPSPDPRPAGSVRLWWLLGLALSIALAGCASAPPAPLPQGGADAAAARAALVDQVWRTIDERHVDPAPPGWADAAQRHRQAVVNTAAGDPQANANANPDPDHVWHMLDRLAGERHDAHTRVEGPRDVRRATLGEVSTPGFSLVQLDGRWWADHVRPGSAAEAAGLRPGLQLLAWNGQDPQALWAARLAAARHNSTPQARERRTLRDWLDGPPGSRVALRWARADGRELTMDISREAVLQPPRSELLQRPGGVAVLRWNRFDPSLTASLLQALRNVTTSRGLVLDLRGNGGGNFDMAQTLLDALLPTATEVWVTHRRDGQSEQRLRSSGRALYTGPLLVLLDSASASGSEMLAAALQHTGRARVLGETSCGCLLAVRRHVPLPDGARLAISEMALQLPDGRRVEGVGVRPDVPVPRTLAALRDGRDEVLEAAERLLSAPR